MLVVFVVPNKSATDKLVRPAADFVIAELAAEPGVSVVAAGFVEILFVVVDVVTCSH